MGGMTRAESFVDEADPEIYNASSAAIMGARLWLKPDAVGLIVGRGHDFPEAVQEKLDSYGACWAYRDYPAEESFRVRRPSAQPARSHLQTGLERLI